MGVIEKAVQWAIAIAKDDSHGYSQYRRQGPDYDCSSFVINAYKQAGADIDTSMVTYTGNMYRLVNYGFKDVYNSIDTNSGKGLQRGDILVNSVHHTVMYIGEGLIVQASIAEDGTADRDGHAKTGDQTGTEIYIRKYYNPSYGWNAIYRYTEDDDDMTYDKFKEFMAKYESEQAAKGIPSDPDNWVHMAHKFVTDHDISDGSRPYSKATRAEMWGMLRTFYRMLKG